MMKEVKLMRYYLLITYPGSGLQHLMRGGDKAIAATEDSKHLLYTIGNQLLSEGIITSYQMVKTIEEEVNRFSI